MPKWHNKNLIRRMPSNIPLQNRLQSTDTDLPSWSWIGWQSMIWLHYGEAALINHQLNSIDETIPITEWYTSDSPSNENRRRIHSTWFENRDKYKDWTRPLPDGWTRHSIPTVDSFKDRSIICPENCGQYYFPIVICMTKTTKCGIIHSLFPT